ncbi:MAG: hypothetical protein LAN71_17280 [Acidobacteriia bacterium]|nr:hypothetical protein [Terriglobia bacterium]
MIFDWIFKRKIEKKEDRKIKCTEFHTKEEYRKALIDAIDSAKKEIIIITDDFSEFYGTRTCYFPAQKSRIDNKL